MRTLTPLDYHTNQEVSPLFSFNLLIIPSSTIQYNLVIALATTTALLMIFRLRHHLAGSSSYHTETGSLSYGLIIRFQLLPTLPHGNAVIFSYKVYGLPWKGLTPYWLNAFEGVLGVTVSHEQIITCATWSHLQHCKLPFVRYEGCQTISKDSNKIKNPRIKDKKVYFPF